MRHFGYLTGAQTRALFSRAPQPFDASSDRRTLAVALGATLYTPGTRADYAGRVGRLLGLGVASSVLCLEDAIADADVAAAEHNVVAQLSALHEAGAAAPLLFVRVRCPDQLPLLVKELGDAAAVLSGFVFPKFTAAAGRDYFDALADVRSGTGLPLYGMPVLETGEVMYAETRLGELLALRALLGEYREAVLAVRIGATDLCGLYGLRRRPDLTVYDLAVVREAIAAIVNVLARDDGFGDGFTVSGPVWEYFTAGERVLKPLLRNSPFEQRGDLPRAGTVRDRLVHDDLDGLLREVLLDRATGITGKTVIHPAHVRLVHAMYVVTAEEWADACTTLELPAGGVSPSAYANKMIESKPHARWAAATLHRAAVFGVLAESRTFVDLLDLEDVPQ